MWYVYILQCRNNLLYTGITRDVRRRFKEHQRKGARYTSYNPPVKVLYKEIARTRSQALKREAEIKRWTRAEKLLLIRKDFAIRNKIGGTGQALKRRIRHGY